MMAFGKTLRDAREAKGLTISQVAEQTHMMSSIIQGLENEDFTKIVAPIYGRGFVKLFCETVGIDPKPLIAEFMELYSGSRIPGIRERATAKQLRRQAPQPQPPPPPQEDYYSDPPQPAPAPEPTYAAPIPEPAPPRTTYAAPTPEPAPQPVYAPPPPPQPITVTRPAAYDPRPVYTHERAPEQPPSPDYGEMFAETRGRIVQPELNGMPPSRQPFSASRDMAPIEAPEPPQRDEDNAKKKLSRYGSPLHDIHATKPTMPTVPFPPNLWRLVLLIIVTLGLLCGMIIGIRTLYRLTTDHTPINGAANVTTPTGNAYKRPATNVQPSSSKGKTAKPADNGSRKHEKPVPLPTGRTPQNIPSLYVD